MKTFSSFVKKRKLSAVSNSTIFPQDLPPEKKICISKIEPTDQKSPVNKDTYLPTTSPGLTPIEVSYKHDTTVGEFLKSEPFRSGACNFLNLCSKVHFEKIRNTKNFPPIDLLNLNSVPIHHYYQALPASCFSQGNQIFKGDFESFGDFENFLFAYDPFYALNKHEMWKRWEQRIQKKRLKIPAKQQFYDFLQNHNIMPKIVFNFNELKNLPKGEIGSFLKPLWSPELYLHDVSMLYPKKLFDKHHKAFLNHKKSFLGITTVVWSRPPGVNFILINKIIARFYRFRCGSHIFPTKEVISPNINFFNMTTIDDGLFMNPPYNELLDAIIASLVIMANEAGFVYPVLVPFWPTAKWFKVLTYLQTPCIKLCTKLCFQYGEKRLYAKNAKFHSCIFLIGAFTVQPTRLLENDMLGFPLSSKYAEYFEKVTFPANIGKEHGSLDKKSLPAKIQVLHTVLDHAEKINACYSDTDITHKFNFDVMQKYNHLLQTVEDDINALNSQSWAFRLNPWISSHVSWSRIKSKDRRILSYQEGINFIKAFDSEPRETTKKQFCKICKNLGHILERCPHKIPSIAELGLCSLIEKAFYGYLTQLDFSCFKSQSRDHFESAQKFIQKAIFWISETAIFWENWDIFANNRNIDDPSSILLNEEFSKGRGATGFNYAQGASLSELLLDSFGAVLYTSSPPPIL